MSNMSENKNIQLHPASHLTATHSHSQLLPSPNFRTWAPWTTSSPSRPWGFEDPRDLRLPATSTYFNILRHTSYFNHKFGMLLWAGLTSTYFNVYHGLILASLIKKVGDALMQTRVWIGLNRFESVWIGLNPVNAAEKNGGEIGQATCRDRATSLNHALKHPGWRSAQLGMTMDDNAMAADPSLVSRPHLQSFDCSNCSMNMCKHGHRMS